MPNPIPTDLLQGTMVQQTPASPEADRTLAGQADTHLPNGTGEGTNRHTPQIPGYAILKELGEGGMGIVYKACHVGLNRIVALKMIRGHVGQSELTRFRLEAEAIAKLQHPHIVQVFDIGQHNGWPYFSLEYVNGGSLAERLDNKPIPPKQAAEWTAVLANAMQAAHQKGIVHRDLKPANILIADGKSTLDSPLSSMVLKITDFGLAKQLDADSSNTRSGSIMGTPSYMAPEQALGHIQQIGPATDVYALGAILYEMLTGRPPFQGVSMLETLDQVRTQEPLPPSSLQPHTPKDLETICLKCLRKEPCKRYATAAELEKDLRRWLTNQPILARPVGSVERLWKWIRRHPSLAALSAISILAVLTLLVGGFVYNRKLQKMLNEEAELRQIADKEANRAQACSLSARTNLDRAMQSLDAMLAHLTHEQFKKIPSFEKERQEILAEAVSLYETLIKENDDNPNFREETAQIYQRLGFLYRQLGLESKANESYCRSIEEFEEILETTPNKTKITKLLEAVKQEMAER